MISPDYRPTIYVKSTTAPNIGEADIKVVKERYKTISMVIPYSFNAVGEFQEAYLIKSKLLLHIHKTNKSVVYVMTYIWLNGVWVYDERLIEQLPVYQINKTIINYNPVFMDDVYSIRWL